MADKYLHKVSIPNAATVTTIYTVPAANSAIIRCILEESDVLKVTSSQTDATFYLSYLEVDRN